MINKTDKFNIVLVLIIIIIIGLCLFSKKELFFSGTNNLTIYDRRLNRFFLANSICTNDHDLFFIANMDYGDNDHINFMKHDLGVEKLRIGNIDIEDKLPNIVFKIIFYQGYNLFTIQKVVVKSNGDTIPPGNSVGIFDLSRYIPYRFIPNPVMKRKIKGDVKYFMINVYNDDYMLERQGDDDDSMFKAQHIKYLNEKHRHIFFLIPYYARSTIKGTNMTQGCNAIWNLFN